MNRASLNLLPIALVLFFGTSWALENGYSLEAIFQDEWESFKSIHKKSYGSEEEERFRQKIYMENRHEIAKHNKGNSSFTLGMNRFGDLLFHEFSSIYNGYRMDPVTYEMISNESATFLSPANVQIPDSIDWREAGAVTPVKDQGNCGGCWAFGATGSLEGVMFRLTGTLNSMSEQQLIDCATDDVGCSGCEGGNTLGAFLYIRNNRGIDSEKSYPYEAKEEQCRYNPNHRVASDMGFVQINSGSEYELKLAVATQGPTAVAISVGPSFKQYNGGVYYEPSCLSDITSLNHGVLVVGYGTEDGNDYWLVKNSWGPLWGESGYIKMARKRDNNCGIATLAGYPIY